MELEFPEIETAPAAQPQYLTTVATGALDFERLDLADLARAKLNPARKQIADAVKTLTGVQHDLPTQAKIDEAISLRNRLIKTPVAEARKVAKGLKSKLDSVSKDVGAELAEIVAESEKADALITPQIDAAQSKIDEEKRLAAEKEAARVQKHRDNLATLTRPAEKAAEPDMTADRISNGIKAVEAITIDPTAWEEFAQQAEDRKAVTLERMRALHAQAVAREAEAARLKAEREEAERVAAAQKAEADRLAALAAELERERAALQAEKDRAAAEAQAKIDEAARLEREQREESERQARELQEARERAEKAEAIETAEAALAEEEKPAIAIDLQGPEAFVPAAPAPEPTLTLGMIKERIAPVSIDAAGLESLGFKAITVGASKRYYEADFAPICSAISSHCLTVAARKHQEAA